MKELNLVRQVCRKWKFPDVSLRTRQVPDIAERLTLSFAISFPRNMP